MTRQINLCPQRTNVARGVWPAHQVLLVMAGVCVLVMAITTAWVMSLNRSTAANHQRAAANKLTIATLQKQLGLEASAVAMSAPALEAELQARRAELARQQARLLNLQRGALAEGSGHAARLALVARTIPASAWLSQIKLDQDRLELSGATLEPAALNRWLDELAASPLLKDLRLAAVKVERLPSEARQVPARLGKATVWQFTLSSSGVGL